MRYFRIITDLHLCANNSIGKIVIAAPDELTAFKLAQENISREIHIRRNAGGTSLSADIVAIDEIFPNFEKEGLITSDFINRQPQLVGSFYKGIGSYIDPIRVENRERIEELRNQLAAS